MAQALPTKTYKATTRLAAKHIERMMDGRLSTEQFHTAAEAGDIETILNLIADPDVDLDLRDQRQNTPLHLAADEGHLECVHALINAKVQPCMLQSP